MGNMFHFLLSLKLGAEGVECAEGVESIIDGCNASDMFSLMLGAVFFDACIASVRCMIILKSKIDSWKESFVSGAKELCHGTRRAQGRQLIKR